MNNRLRIMKIAILVAAGWPMYAVGDQAQQAEGGVSSNLEYTVYTVQEEDTLASIALRFLGGEQYTKELLKYNQIANPSRVAAGMLLAIPREVRSRAIAGLSEAEKNLAIALDAQAEVYAPNVYAEANQTIRKSRQARENGAYHQATALAHLGDMLAKHAKELADQRAPILQAAKVGSVQGDVAVSSDEGRHWDPVEVGDRLPVNAILRTGPASRARLDFPDGSVVRILPSTRFVIRNLLYDRRNKKRKSRLKILLGNILGHIEPREHRESQFEIDTGAASIAIRGTALRAGTDEEEITRISTLTGQLAVLANEERVEVSADRGTYVKQGKPPAPPVQLLPAPRVLLPEPDGYRTARQQVSFSWERRPGNKEASAYHFELASETGFDQLVQDRQTSRNNLKTETLQPGTYFYRLSSIDHRGLEGNWSTVRKLEVFRDLRVKISPRVEPLVTATGPVVGKDHGFLAEPLAAGSSVVKIECSLNEGPYGPVQEEIRLDREGANEIRIRGIGADGIKGEIDLMGVELDTTPPEISHLTSRIEDHPDRGKVRRLTLTATDKTGVERIEYRLGAQPFEAYTEPILVSALDESVTIYRAVDVLGNISPDKHCVIEGEIVPRGNL